MESKNSRRRFLAQAALLGTAGWMAGPAEAKKKIDPDAVLLDELLGKEHEIIFAYGLLIDGPKSDRDLPPVARQLRQNHQARRDVLMGFLRRLGESPKMATPGYFFNDPTDTEKDLLLLAARLERGLADAYLSRLDRFINHQWVRETAGMMADSIVELSELRRLLNRPAVYAYRDLQI